MRRNRTKRMCWRARRKWAGGKEKKTVENDKEGKEEKSYIFVLTWVWNCSVQSTPFCIQSVLHLMTLNKQASISNSGIQC